MKLESSIVARTIDRLVLFVTAHESTVVLLTQFARNLSHSDRVRLRLIRPKQTQQIYRQIFFLQIFPLHVT